MKYLFETNEEQEARLCFKGKDAYLALHELQNRIRRKWKYDEPENETWYQMYEIFFDVLKEYDIDIDRDLN